MMAKRPQRAPIDMLWDAQNGCCFHCGEPMMRKGSINHPLRRSREHLIPQSRGGKGKPVVVLAHRSCNSALGNPEPTPDEITRAESIYAVIGALFWSHRPYVPPPVGALSFPFADLAERLGVDA